MLLADTKLASHRKADGDTAEFSVEFDPSKDDVLFLRFPDRTNFASVNTHVSQALRPLLEKSQLRLEAVVNISTARDRIRQAKTANDARLRVYVNVYGPRTTREHIGQELSKKQVWLQKPDHWKPGTAYENPHVLTFNGLEQPVVSQPVPVEQSAKRLFNNPEEFQKAVDGVYASLRRDDNLQQVEKDRRVKTTLLP
jgi:SWI/SNF-related matrix-associated actin-dependent regulator of chromatin subfamily A3